jgi:hypothetical protein
MAYDRSVAPKEGKSAISGATRNRIFGGRRGVGSFNEWLNQGGAGGPVRTDGGNGIDINTQRVEGLQTPVQPQLDVTGELFNPQQMLANMFNPQAGSAQQETPADQQKKLQMWIDWMREKQASDLQRPDIAARALDPVRYAQEQYTARQASDPWGPGGQFEKSPRLSPAAALASQGNNATNQWAQLGGAPGIDPEELRRLNAAAAAGRGYRNYF